MAQKRNLCGQLVQHLGAMVLSGVLQPGDSIPSEESLLLEMGVSRTVLREAVKSLEAKGLLQSKPKKGTTVRDRADWNFLDADVLGWALQSEQKEQYLLHMTELRQAIEPSAAAIIATRGTSGAIEGLEAAVRRMAECHDSETEWAAAELSFHTQLLVGARNPLFASMVPVIRFLLSASLQVTNRDPARNLPAVSLHKDILDAIMARDPGRAREAMLRMFSDALDRIKTNGQGDC